MRTFAGTVAVLVLTVAPMRTAGATPCTPTFEPTVQCSDGDPTCDLDERCDGRCILALCETGSPKAPRHDFCAGSLAWTSILRLPAGRDFSRASGTCPEKVRQLVRCRPAHEDSACYRPRARMCTVSFQGPTLDTGGPVTTRCRVDVLRRVRGLDGHAAALIDFWLLDRRFRKGYPAELTFHAPTPLSQGTFTSGDRERRLVWVAGNVGGQSIPIARIDVARLELIEVSDAPTIWTDDIHGTLDLDVSEGPRRAITRIEF